MKHRLTAFCRAALAATCFSTLVLSGSPARAFPGVFAGKTAAQLTSRATQVVVMKNGKHSVVTVMTDYEGPMMPFALVLPVPADVDAAQVKVLKRADIERLEELTAPRFHEFWEMDPCEAGETQQVWERNLKASAGSDFLGGGDMFKSSEKVPKEMKISVEPSFRDDAEYKLSVVKNNVDTWLAKKGYKLPAGSAEKLKGHPGAFIVAVVDPRQVELGPTGGAMLSPIRYATDADVEIQSTFGLANADRPQELIIYVLDKESRYEAANYENAFPPTNVRVDFAAKERMSDFYANLHDKILLKNGKAVLTEYAWSTADCGQPCPDAPLHLSEHLTLGGDVFESYLDDAVRNPKPPARSDEEQKAYEAADKDEKKRLDALVKEVARRKALIERQGEYVLTRLHHRYTAATLPADIKLKPAGALAAGVEAPQGPDGTLPPGQQTSEHNQVQTRFYFLHENKAVVKCDNPQRYRWGKPPRTYRGARKVWIANQLAFRDRKRVKAEELVWTDIPSLGLSSKAPNSAPEPAAKVSEQSKTDDGGCSLSGYLVSSHSPRVPWLLAVPLLARLLRRRRR